MANKGLGWDSLLYVVLRMKYIVLVVTGILGGGVVPTDALEIPPALVEGLISEDPIE